MDTQKAFSWDKITLQKTGKGLLIALAGALAVFLEQAIPGIDFGQYSIIAVAINSAIINAIREWIKSSN
jgi:hypothetical protein